MKNVISVLLSPVTFSIVFITQGDVLKSFLGHSFPLNEREWRVAVKLQNGKTNVYPNWSIQLGKHIHIDTIYGNNFRDWHAQSLFGDEMYHWCWMHRQASFQNSYLAATSCIYSTLHANAWHPDTDDSPSCHGTYQRSQRLKLKIRTVKGQWVAARLLEMEATDTLSECMIRSRARCSTWQAPWAEGISASCLPSDRTCSHLSAEVWKRGSTWWKINRIAVYPWSSCPKCCPKQIVSWNCSLPNSSFVC